MTFFQHVDDSFVKVGHPRNRYWSLVEVVTTFHQQLIFDNLESQFEASIVLQLQVSTSYVGKSQTLKQND